MKTNFFVFAIVALVLSACAHHRDVRPGARGIHRVVVKSEDGDEGTQDAIAQANHFCSERYKRNAAFLNERANYTGDIDEKQYKNGKRLSKVASVAGGGLFALGGGTHTGVGAVGGLAAIGGMAGDAALGKAYKVEMKFKCM